LIFKTILWCSIWLSVQLNFLYSWSCCNFYLQNFKSFQAVTVCFSGLHRRSLHEISSLIALSSEWCNERY
jgi:hypothetical protein